MGDLKVAKRGAGKGRGGKRKGAGRPPGRQNNRTILLRQGLDQEIPDPWFFQKVKKAIEDGGPAAVAMLIQVGKWKGLTDRHEVVGDSFTEGTVFKSFLSTGETALAPPPKKSGDAPTSR